MAKNAKHRTDTLELADYRRRNRILATAAAAALVIVIAKAGLHYLGWEPIGSSTLYATIITGGFFVLGFILSATISDYKEAEKLPAEFSAIIENMYEDVQSIHANYAGIDAKGFSRQLAKIMETMKEDLVTVSREAHHEVHKLSAYFADMERTKVPPNFIAKLKAEQGQLIRMLFRAYYIQTIQFIPSAIILAKVIVVVIIGLLLLTNIEPPSASLWLSGVITFIFIYIIRLIKTISVPFHPSGTTQDDVSLFLIDRAINHLKKH